MPSQSFPIPVQTVSTASHPDPLWDRLAHCLALAPSPLSLDNAAQIIAEEGPASACILIRLSREQDLFVPFAGYTRRPPTSFHTSPSNFTAYPSDLSLDVLASGEPLILRCDQLENRVQAQARIDLLGTRFVSAGVFPLTCQPVVQAVMVAGEEREWIRAPFTRERMRRLELGSLHIGTAIGQMVWKEQAQLNEIGRTTSSSLEIDTVLDEIYNHVLPVVKADLYSIGLWDPESTSLNMDLLVAGGRRMPPCRVPCKVSILGDVIADRTSHLVWDLHSEQYANAPPNAPYLNGFHAWLGVPLTASDQLLGALGVASRQAGAFREQDREILEKIADQASAGLANALHHHQVEEQAHRDGLTQVLNRVFFLTRLEQETKRAKEQGLALSLIVFDIDHFKGYNDDLGHLVGDNILYTVAQAIRTRVKHADLIGRWGGDEFVIALPGSDLQDALRVANRIREILASPELEAGRRRNIPALTVSQGIAALDAERDAPLALIDRADRALYQAKRGGRDQVRVFE